MSLKVIVMILINQVIKTQIFCKIKSQIFYKIVINTLKIKEL